MQSYIKKSLCPLVLLFILALTMPANAKTEKIEKTFSVNKGGALVIECSQGSIDVGSWNEDEVSVSVIKRGLNLKDLKSYKVQIEQKGNDIYIKGVERQHNNIEVVFTVDVPRGYNVTLKTDEGYINVNDIKGNVDAYTSKGNIKVADVDGSLKADALGGKIHLENSL